MSNRFRHCHFALLVIVTASTATVVLDGVPTVTSYFVSVQQSHGWYQSLGFIEFPVDSIMNIGESTALQVLHERNYPRPSNLCKGLNDTLVLQIKFMNHSYHDVFWEKNPEIWVAPRLFNIYSNIATDSPSIDSTELSYSVRRWVWLGRTLAQAPPDSFPAKRFEYTMYLNVWGFPEGQWVLSAGLTENAPTNINVLESGMEFTYFTAQDAQDSVNAYIGCAQRAMIEHDYNKAITWVDEALGYFPKSVPAWWERGNLLFDSGDSLQGVAAMDSALFYLDGFKDPLLPDTTKEIEPIERLFIRYLAKRLLEDHDGERYRW